LIDGKRLNFISTHPAVDNRRSRNFSALQKVAVGVAVVVIVIPIVAAVVVL
jgi:hypothetical protein